MPPHRAVQVLSHPSEPVWSPSLDSANRRVVLLTSITFNVQHYLLLEEIPWRRSEPCGRDAEVSSKSCALFFIRDGRSLVSIEEAMTFTLSSRE